MSKEIIQKVIDKDITAIADLKEKIYSQVKFDYGIDESKSKEASAVLQLMDKDYSYKDALEKVIKDTGYDKVKLEKELDKYI